VQDEKIYPKLLPSCGTVSRSYEAGVIALLCSESYTCRLHSVVVVVVIVVVVLAATAAAAACMESKVIVRHSCFLIFMAQRLQ
jgi:hypothetical protein